MYLQLESGAPSLITDVLFFLKKKNNPMTSRSDRWQTYDYKRVCDFKEENNEQRNEAQACSGQVEGWTIDYIPPLLHTFMFPNLSWPGRLGLESFVCPFLHLSVQRLVFCLVLNHLPIFLPLRVWRAVHSPSSGIDVLTLLPSKEDVLALTFFSVALCT